MMGLRIAQCVGNAHVFIVLHDLETDKDYGMHVEVTDISFSHSGIGGDFELDGTMVSNETVELSTLDKMLNE